VGKSILFKLSYPESTERISIEFDIVGSTIKIA
jgi:hypothetical protein